MFEAVFHCTQKGSFTGGIGEKLVSERASYPGWYITVREKGASSPPRRERREESVFSSAVLTLSTTGIIIVKNT